MVFLAAMFGVLVTSTSYAALFLGNLENKAQPILPINVACVGDSITEWSGYPSDLQAMLGDGYRVGNFGVAGASVSTKWHKPYLKQSAFQESKDFQPSIIVIMLGTNDAHTYQSTSDFEIDYKKLVSEYKELGSNPKIFLVKPPPIYDNELELSSMNLQVGVIPYIELVADELDLSIVDVNSALANNPDFFEDGVHPNRKGAMTIAVEVLEAITQDFP